MDFLPNMAGVSFVSSFYFKLDDETLMVESPIYNEEGGVHDNAFEVTFEEEVEG
jgi:hypothetical protein